MADAIQVSIGAMLSGGFASAFSEANGAVSSLGAHVKDLQGKVGQVGAYQNLEREVSDLSKATEEAKARTSALKAELVGVEKPTKAQTKAVKEAEREEAKLNDTLGKKQKALADASSALKRMGVDTANVTEEQKRLNAELERQQMRQQGLNKFREIAGIKDSGVKTIGERMGTLRDRGVSAFRDIGIAVGVLGGGLFALAKKTADYGDEVAETAAYLNISTSALQEFRGVAERVGVGTESMDKALQKFSLSVGNAANAGAKGKQKFKELGLNLDQIRKMGPEKAMMKVADAISRMKDPARQAAAAAELFGAKNTKMLNILRGGSKALEEARAEIRKTGMVMSEDGIRKSGEWDDAWNKLTQTMKGVGSIVGMALVPQFTAMFNQVGDWLQNHQPEVQVFAEKLATGFAQVARHLPAIATGLADVAGKVFGLVTAAADLTGGWDNLIMVMAAVRLAPVALGVIQLGQSLFMATSALWAAAGGFAGIGSALGIVGGILTGPVLIGIAAVIGGILLLYKYWDYVSAFFKGMAQGMSEALSPITDGLKPIFDGLAYLGNIFLELLAPVDATEAGFARAMSAGQLFGQIVGESIRMLLFPIEAVLKGLSAIGDMAGWVGEKLGLNDGQTTVAKAGMTDEAKARMQRIEAAKNGSSAAPIPTPSAPQSVSKSESHSYSIKIDGSKDPDATAKAVRMEMDRRERERAASKRSSYSTGGTF